MPILLYGSTTMQMSNLKGLLGIREIYRVPNIRIRELYGVAKGVDVRNDESILRWFGHIKRMKNDRIAKWVVYVEKCVGSRLVGRSRKKWMDSMNDS